MNFVSENEMNKCNLQGCSADSDDWTNSDDFLGKSLELIFVIIPPFPQILTA